MIRINDNISIDENQLVFKFSRSQGPGGQNVNKVNTRVTIYFNVANAESFTDAQKRTVLARLKTRADKTGVIRVFSQKHRTQKANKAAATKRLVELLAQALQTPRKRRKTTVPRYAIEQRLKEKKHRSRLKQQRGKSDFPYE